jgi:hypothetical protein
VNDIKKNKRDADSARPAAKRKLVADFTSGMLLSALVPAEGKPGQPVKLPADNEPD